MFDFRLLALSALLLTSINVRARLDPVFLVLRGVGDGSLAELQASSTDIQVSEHYVYQTWAQQVGTNSLGGFEIFCATNPAAPRLVGVFTSPLQANAIRVIGNRAFVAEGTKQSQTNDPGALEIIDRADKTHPVRLDGIETLGRPTRSRFPAFSRMWRRAPAGQERISSERWRYLTCVRRQIQSARRRLTRRVQSLRSMRTEIMCIWPMASRICGYLTSVIPASHRSSDPSFLMDFTMRADSSLRAIRRPGCGCKVSWRIPPGTTASMCLMSVIPRVFRG